MCRPVSTAFCLLIVALGTVCTLKEHAQWFKLHAVRDRHEKSPRVKGQAALSLQNEPAIAPPKKMRRVFDRRAQEMCSALW